MFFGIGRVSVSGLAGAVMPSWRIFVLLISVPPLVVSLFRCWVPETPHHFAAKGDAISALEVLQTVSTRNKTLALSLSENVRLRLNAVRAAPGTSPLSPRWVRITCCISAVWFLLAFDSEWMLWEPAILEDIGISGSAHFEWLLVLNSNELVVPIAVRACGLAGATSMVSKRRRLATVSAFNCCILFALVILIRCHISSTIVGVVAVLASYLTIAMWVLLYAWTPLLYPPQMRAAGFGVAMTVSRIGSSISPLIASNLLPILGGSGPLLLSAMGFVITIALIFLLQEEPIVMSTYEEH